MKVTKVTKLKDKYTQYDISTGTENFFVKTNTGYVLVHNSPAIFTGIDPSDGKFFVAKKGIFNVSPKLYKTDEEINQDLSGDLAEKFRIALREFKKLRIKSGVIQGDLMFTKSDLKTETIDGTSYTTFHPNTIVYAVPKGSELEKKVSQAQIGVVWHTSYTGDSLQNMTASFGKNIVSTLTQTKDVWQDDANYKDVSGTATFTAAETKSFTQLLSQAGRLFKTIQGPVMKKISDDETLKTRFKAFNNSLIRGRGINFNNIKPQLLSYFNEFYDKEIAKKNSPRAKETWEGKKAEVLGFINSNMSSIQNMYRLMGVLTQAKEFAVDKLNQGASIPTFLKTAYGFKVTDAEGFVAIDKLEGGAVKLVNRMEFSRANFSPEIIKGWQK